MRPTRWTRMAWIVIALALAAAVLAPSLAEQSALVARVEESFEIGGEVYPASRLTVKSVREFNPSSVIGEIWVEGECLGLFRAARVEPDGDGTVDTLTFERSGAGRLAFVGFTVVESSGQVSYRFDLPSSRGAVELAQR